MQSLRNIRSKKKNKSRTLDEEPGILKLVHPGCHVEIHKQPISASQVMKKNPRHSVARPDVFSNPWLVVRPDAILHPGRVFLIVPNSTLYQLLKSRRERREFSPHPAYYQLGREEGKGNHGGDAGSLPEPEMVASNVNGSFDKEEEEEGHETDSPRIRLSSSFYHRNARVSPGIPDEDSARFGFGWAHQDGQVAKLKPCLRNPESGRRLLGLRVTFNLPRREG
ncbi:unnamed protein product [Linum tenue]|uniref:Uncharacterized protein n=1 Tax=Linum tenue TaxID=586396 RepID=A0AAV0KWN9_9ROSI|nr:unnamed protein product [Linum tenue]